MQLVLFFALARLLTPEEIGLYSVVVAILGLAHVLRDFGVTSYLIQERELTREKIATAFTLTLIVAVTLFAVLYFSADMIARFYDDVRVAAVVRVMAINFLLLPFSSTALALLRREMRFDAMFWIAGVSTIANFVVALALALFGYGYWSLVLASVASTAATCIVATCYSINGLVHRLTLSEWRVVTNFGVQSSVARIVSEVALNMNELVIGRVLGFSAVGIFSRAQGVMNLFHRDLMGAVKNVAFPAFAKAHRTEDDMEEIHIKSTATAAAFAWPFFGFFFLFPAEAILLMFGPRWGDAVPLVPIFCVAGSVAVLWTFSLQLLTAMGRIDLTMKAELIVQSVRILIVLLCALFFANLEGFAYGVVVAFSLNCVIIYCIKQSLVPIKLKSFVHALSKSAILSVVALLPALILRSLLWLEWITMQPIAVFVLALFLTSLFWLIGVFATRHPLRDEKIVVDGVRKARALAHRIR